MEGGDALAQGFYRGFTGLVTKPLQGARTGVGGAPHFLPMTSVSSANISRRLVRESAL